MDNNPNTTVAIIQAIPPTISALALFIGAVAGLMKLLRPQQKARPQDSQAQEH